MNAANPHALLFHPTSSGFELTLDTLLDISTLNLYGTQTGGQGDSDVVVTGAVVGPVAGSLLVSADGLRIVFVKTGGPLLPDTYTVTLRSATDRFRHANGLLLDGNRDGVPGGDFVTTFTVGATRLPVLSVPDVARAPGQNVNVPATDTGLPLRISDGTGVQTVSLDFVYDPTLLSITGAALAATMPVSALLNTDTSVPGRLRATVQLSDPLSSGPQDILLMTATVPASAPYRAAGVLRIENVSINGTVGGVLTDDAVQVVALLGDTTGDGRYSSLDGQRVLRVAAGLDTGFAGYPLIDPVIIGDVTGDGRISSLDATRILQKVSGLPVPQIP